MVCISDVFTDMKYIESVLRDTHQAEEDYNMKLELIILALHITEERHVRQSDNIVDLLNDFLRGSTCSQFRAAVLPKESESHIVVFFCDIEHDEAQSVIEEESYERLNEVLRRMLWLSGDLEYLSHDPSGKSTKHTRISDLLRLVNTHLRRSALLCCSELIFTEFTPFSASSEPISCIKGSDPSSTSLVLGGKECQLHRAAATRRMETDIKKPHYWWVVTCMMSVVHPLIALLCSSQTKTAAPFYDAGVDVEKQSIQVLHEDGIASR